LENIDKKKRKKLGQNKPQKIQSVRFGADSKTSLVKKVKKFNPFDSSEGENTTKKTWGLAFFKEKVFGQGFHYAKTPKKKTFRRNLLLKIGQ